MNYTMSLEFPLEEGQIFESLQAFKSRLQAWSIEDLFTDCITHNDCTRVMAKCRTDVCCPFHVRCGYQARNYQAKVDQYQQVDMLT